MIDEYIIEDEMNKLKNIIFNNKMYKDRSNNFFRDYDWEDEFSHNDIYEMQLEFMKQAQIYLKKICPCRYVMYCDWCVHICTIEFFNKYLKNNIRGYLKC